MKRFTEKRGDRNAIPLRKSVCGVDLPRWSIGRPNDLEIFLYGDASDRLTAYEDAEEEGRLIILPCKIGAKVLDINADYIFTVEKVETCMVHGKPALIFRCGNPGKSDYMAFYDFEIGENIEILPEGNDE